ncbi:MAG TPA: hypothetical protein VL418_00190 [Devosiaceae bacterium]|nr:hypothetical protein [Devosiaceae bacterium]
MSEKTAKGNALLRGERLQIMLETGELTALDDFRFANRLPSRAAAVRELLRRGLAAEGFAIERPGGPSRSFGVLDGSESSADGADGE